jgi:raffinose/stachyose/melibiose transport system substrate-binding protein
MTVRKLLMTTLIGVLAVAAAFATGTTEAAEAEAEAVTLTVFHHMSEQAKRDALDSIVDLYTEANPNVEVRIEAVDFSNFDATLRTRIAGGDAPDIIFGRAVSRPELVTSGQIMALDGEDFLENVNESALDSMTLEGSVWGVPLSISSMGVYYNRALFEEYGAEVPQTYDELIALCEMLESEGVTPFVFGFRDGWTAQVVFQSDFSGGPLRSIPQFYADTMSGDSNFEDYPELIAALERYEERLQFGNDDPFSVDYARSLAAFSTGEAAMLMQGLWSLGDIRRNNPDGDFGFFLNPAYNTVSENFLNISADDAFMISAQTEHPEEAKAFLAVLASQEGSETWAEIATSIPVARGADTSNLDPILAEAQAYMDAGRAFNFESIPGYSGQFDATWRQAQEEYAAADSPNPADFAADLTAQFERIRASQ